MLFPTYVLDNFFDDPHKVIKFASSLKYEQDPEGVWPGKRTDALQHIDNDLFQHITTRMMRLLYPENIKQLTWTANSYFQYIDYGVDAKEGWIHKDTSSQLSSVIYHIIKNAVLLFINQNFFCRVLNKNILMCAKIIILKIKNLIINILKL